MCGPRRSAGLGSAVRRGLDVMLASFGLVIAAPVMGCISILIRIDSLGPIFFAQARLGLDGRHFIIYKFRKFGSSAGGASGMVTLKNDPRMTRVGGVLERWKLDELPQLWNVLVGDMAIVGPRPEALAFADCFTGSLLQVLDFKPGLFGPSQSVFRNEKVLYPEGEDPHEFYRTRLFPAKARIDLAYYPSRTVVSDLGWIVRSVLAVLGLTKFPDYSGSLPNLDVVPVGTPPKMEVADVLTWCETKTELDGETARAGF
jgi:lipopolysaccharide/colanic/teichoic acid biosynthesis glycosyltransferase